MKSHGFRGFDYVYWGFVTIGSICLLGVITKVCGDILLDLMMKSILSLSLFLTLLLSVHSTVVPHVGPIDSHAPLTFRVNLEDPL